MSPWQHDPQTWSGRVGLGWMRLRVRDPRVREERVLNHMLPEIRLLPQPWGAECLLGAGGAPSGCGMRFLWPGRLRPLQCQQKLGLWSPRLVGGVSNDQVSLCGWVYWGVGVQPACETEVQGGGVCANVNPNMWVSISDRNM